MHQTGPRDPALGGGPAQTRPPARAAPQEETKPALAAATRRARPLPGLAASLRPRRYLPGLRLSLGLGR